jgi:hypothetical protein
MSDLNLIIILMLIKFPVSSTPEYSKFIENIDDVVEIRLRCMVKIENFTHYYFKKKKKKNLKGYSQFTGKQIHQQKISQFTGDPWTIHRQFHIRNEPKFAGELTQPSETIHRNFCW